MNEYDSILGDAQSWLINHSRSLADRGIKLTVSKSPYDGRTKESAWFDLEDETKMGRIILWDTGECELELADIPSGEVTAQHRSIASETDLNEALNALVSWFA
ncbi:immunity protein TriTu family protein [Nocardia sp. NBC_01327]|uniref:immunity protein TriTu family protein n=1 Tax=Nocardia sp. NBC_01327 TaxID=2903593 RepID=UPI002E0DFEED|nr:hypothetical protein OG326_33645 [Nocardia sp. NBC_01327]